MLGQHEWRPYHDQCPKLWRVIFNCYGPTLRISFNQCVAPRDGNVSDPQIVIMAAPYFQNALLIKVEHMQGLRLTIIQVTRLVVYCGCSRIRELDWLKNHIVSLRPVDITKPENLSILTDTILELTFAEITVVGAPGVTCDVWSRSFNVFLPLKPGPETEEMHNLHGARALARANQGIFLVLHKCLWEADSTLRRLGRMRVAAIIELFFLVFEWGTFMKLRIWFMSLVKVIPIVLRAWRPKEISSSMMGLCLFLHILRLSKSWTQSLSIEWIVMSHSERLLA
jgi:hypothetical protein